MDSHSLAEPMDVDNVNDNDYLDLPVEVLRSKVNLLTKLCLTNKINSSNAFDIDFIGYFKSFVQKYPSHIGNPSLFMDIGLYLEASRQIYSHRIDHCTESTYKLLQAFNDHYLKSGIKNKNEELKTRKQKRLMLTTSEKLRSKRKEMIVIPHIKLQGFPSINYMKIIEDSNTFGCMKTLYSDSTLQDEFDELLTNHDDQISDDEKFIELPDIDFDFENEAICHEFKNFGYKSEENNLVNNNTLDCIEYRFSPDNYNDNDEPVSNIIDNTGVSQNNTEYCLRGLINCVDNVKRDYSFFNPQRLARWKGPKEWKTQAMSKALKSVNQSVHNTNISSSDICDNINGNIEQSYTNKKSTKKKQKKYKIEWFTSIDQIKKNRFKNCFKGKEKLSQATVKKWRPSKYNDYSSKINVMDTTYKLSILPHIEIKHQHSSATICPNETNTAATSSQQCSNGNNENEDNENHDDVSRLNVDTSETNNDDEMDMAIEVVSNDEENSLDIRQSNIDISMLKEEILNVINEECVQIDSENEWSCGFPFLRLLEKLEVIRRELSINIIFVGLLHLASELGLKLRKEPGQTHFQDLYIFKPINKK